MKREYDKPAIKEAVAKCWCSKTKKKFGIVVTSEMGELWIVQHSFLCSDHYVDKTAEAKGKIGQVDCLLYTSPSPRDLSTSRMPSSA